MYDKSKAQKVVSFFENYLTHTKGEWAGKPFILYPWQKKIVRDIFGTVDKKGIRQYKMAYVEISRKNGKSELAAGIALFLLFADKEPGAEIYSAASDRDQASIVFNVAVKMVENCPQLLKRCRILKSTKRIIHNNGSFYRVVSSEAFSKHGQNAHGIIFDELHAQRTRELWDVLTSGSGTRRQPLIFAITTAGYDKQSICYEQHEYARKLLKGTIKDKSFYPVIYALDKDDDWTKKKNWERANPALEKKVKNKIIGFRKLYELKNQFTKAVNSPAYENTFRRLYLNQWTSQETWWLQLKKWDRCGRDLNINDFKGKECYGAIDLASSTDIAALALVFPEEIKNIMQYFAFLFFWVPEATILERSRKEGVNYELWRKQGFITATEGEVIDYSSIEIKINELGEVYNIAEVAFDRWGAIQISQNLESNGFTVVPFGQGYKFMSPATKELLNLTIANKFHHDKNPVLRFMADNMMVTTDPAGSIKPDKSKSKNKIDGMVALIMALDRATRHNSNKSVYEERGMIVI